MLGTASDASKATPTVTNNERRRRELTCQVCPACRISFASATDPGVSRRNSSIQGVVLNASLLRMVVLSPSTARFCSILSRRCCTAVSAPVGRRKYTSTAKATIRTRMNQSMIMKDIRSDDDRLFEHRCRNRNARRFQLLRKFGADTSGSKGSQHTAIRSNSLFLENEDILHADYILFHPRDLSKMSHAPGTVTEARDLDHQGNCRRYLAPHSF